MKKKLFSALIIPLLFSSISMAGAFFSVTGFTGMNDQGRRTFIDFNEDGSIVIDFSEKVTPVDISEEGNDTPQLLDLGKGRILELTAASGFVGKSYYLRLEGKKPIRLNPNIHLEMKN